MIEKLLILKEMDDLDSCSTPSDFRSVNRIFIGMVNSCSSKFLQYVVFITFEISSDC